MYVIFEFFGSATGAALLMVLIRMVMGTGRGRTAAFGYLAWFVTSSCVIWYLFASADELAAKLNQRNIGIPMIHGLVWVVCSWVAPLFGALLFLAPGYRQEGHSISSQTCECSDD